MRDLDSVVKEVADDVRCLTRRLEADNLVARRLARRGQHLDALGEPLWPADQPQLSLCVQHAQRPRLQR